MSLYASGVIVGAALLPVPGFGQTSPTQRWTAIEISQNLPRSR